MKLTDYKVGRKVKIVGINAGHGAELNLMNLGLAIGNIIEIGKTSRLRGPVVVIFRGTEIALGRDLAEKIFVDGI